MFESGEEPDVSAGLGVMNELVVPCIPLLLVHDAEKDLLAVEDMRNRWCSYLGQEMEGESPWRDGDHDSECPNANQHFYPWPESSLAK